MNSWLISQVPTDYGKQIVDSSVGSIAWELLAISGAVAFAISAIHYSIDRNAKNPFKVLAAVVGIGLLLARYDYFPTAIDSVMGKTAERISSNGAFEQFLDTFHQGVAKQFALDLSGIKADVSQTAAVSTDSTKSLYTRAEAVFKAAGVLVSDEAQTATNYVTGYLGGYISALSILLVIIFYELYSILRVSIFQILYAVGPLVMALSILPGAGPILSRWFSALFEVCSWQVIGAIVFELVAKSSAADVYRSSGGNFIALCIANLVFCCAVILIPMIAHRIVGSGFGIVGPAIIATTGAAISGVGKFAKTLPVQAPANLLRASFSGGQMATDKRAKSESAKYVPNQSQKDS